MMSLFSCCHLEFQNDNHLKNIYSKLNLLSAARLLLLTVKILKIGTPEIITIIVLQLEQLDFTVQYCVQKMQTE